MAIDDKTLEKASEEMENKDAKGVIEWASNTFKNNMTLAFSGQAEDCVILDIMHKATGGKMNVFMLDTGRMNEEVYDLVEDIRSKYGVQIRMCSPEQKEVEEMVGEHGINLFYKDPKYRIMCCGVRKVNVLKRVLKEYDAWISGVRRSQIATRSQTKKVQMDGQFNPVKISPIADWTWKQVWDYVKANSLPYCSLYDKGYTSIGCAPCTRPTFLKGEKISEDELRKGRWWWENDGSAKECGLHFSHDKKS